MPSSQASATHRTKKRTADLAEVAFNRLMQAVLTGELKEGERVRESRLAAEWAIGITPLREAVRRMATIGYLVLEPNHAPVVRKISAQDIRQIYALREVLEGFALRSAWERIRHLDLRPLKKLAAKAETAGPKARLQLQLTLDKELHQLWIAPPDNPWLASSLDRLLIYRPNLMNVVAGHREFAEKAFEEHKGILEALEEKDLEKALQRLGQHIQKSGSILAALTESGPSPH